MLDLDERPQRGGVRRSGSALGQRDLDGVAGCPTQAVVGEGVFETAMEAAVLAVAAVKVVASGKLEGTIVQLQNEIRATKCKLLVI